MPDFHNPVAFLLLLSVPIFYFLRKIKFFSQPTFISTVSDWGGKTFEYEKKRRKIISSLSRTFALSGFFLVVLALAEPVVYKQERIYTSRGTDILFVLDVSPSMAARDINGNTRLDAAKTAIQELVEKNQGISFGIVSMTSEAALTIPPTIDHAAFLSRLSSIQAGQLGDGTALGTGICTATFHLSTSLAPKKCIILLTDGENNSDSIHPQTAAELAAKNNITLYTLGIGTNGTVPIDYIDQKTGKKYSGFLNSKFDPTVLRQITNIGSGRYFDISNLNDLSLALTVINRSENTVQSYHSKNINVDYYYRLIAVAAIFIVISWIIRKLILHEFL